MFNKNQYKKHAQKELKLVIHKLRAGYKPDKIILFGSMAKGNIKASSDIDLMIVKKTQKNPWARLKEADKYFDHNFPIDFLIYTPSEIEERLKINDPFVSNIFKNGKVLYEK